MLYFNTNLLVINTWMIWDFQTSWCLKPSLEKLWIRHARTWLIERLNAPKTILYTSIWSASKVQGKLGPWQLGKTPLPFLAICLRKAVLQPLSFCCLLVIYFKTTLIEAANLFITLCKHSYELLGSHLFHSIK